MERKETLSKKISSQGLRNIKQITEYQYEVESFSEVGVKYLVDIKEQSCDCPAFTRGIRRPCKHLITVMKEGKEMAKKPQQFMFGSMGNVEVHEESYEMKTKNGYALDEVVSALQKEIRRGNEDDALYWALEMSMSGYGAYLWRRLCVIAGEDIGIASPLILSIVASGKQASDIAGKGNPKFVETNILAVVVFAMCRSKKSRECCWADWFIQKQLKSENKTILKPIPDYAIDQHTKRGKAMGRKEEHFKEHGMVLNKDVDENSKWTQRAKREYGT